MQVRLKIHKCQLSLEGLSEAVPRTSLSLRSNTSMSIERKVPFSMLQGPEETRDALTKAVPKQCNKVVQGVREMNMGHFP